MPSPAVLPSHHLVRGKSEVGAPATVGEGWRVELSLAAGTGGEVRRRRRPGWRGLAATHAWEHLVRVRVMVGVRVRVRVRVGV